jgi:hypothetical protein
MQASKRFHMRYSLVMISIERIQGMTIMASEFEFCGLFSLLTRKMEEDFESA